SDVLGPEIVNAAIAEVEDEQRRRMSPEEWRIFVEGTREERDRMLDQHNVRLEILATKEKDVATRKLAFEHLSTSPMGWYLDAAGDLWHMSRSCDVKQLVLRVTMRPGYARSFSGCSMPIPPNWCA